MLVVVTWMNFVKSFSRNANMIVFGKPPLNWKKRYLSTTVKEGWIYVLVTKVRNRPQRSPPHYNIYIYPSRTKTRLGTFRCQCRRFLCRSGAKFGRLVLQLFLKRQTSRSPRPGPLIEMVWQTDSRCKAELLANKLRASKLPNKGGLREERNEMQRNETSLKWSKIKWNKVKQILWREMKWKKE